ncbi:hypothetical protein BKI52_00155 [marine bacterium AO1-C]|nr:hypothetical protein BKI52_00155 [marine bacterium AO1-C]
MKLLNSILFLILISLSIQAQNPAITDTELTNLYVRALNSRFDLLLTSDWKYIEMNKAGQQIKNLNISNRYKFLTNEELVELSLSKEKKILVHRLTHKITDQNTVDINFTSILLSATRKTNPSNGTRNKKIIYEVEPKDSKAYQPDIRFVRDEKKKTWKMVTCRFGPIPEN